MIILPENHLLLAPCRKLEGICRSALWAQPDMGRLERDRRWLP